MRRRILFATLLVAVTAVVVLGVPLGFVGSRLIRTEFLRQLDRDANTVAAAVEDRQESGAALSPDLLGRFAGEGQWLRVSTPDGHIEAGRRPRGRLVTARAVTVRGAQVEVTIAASALEGRSARVWALVAALGAGGIAASVIVAVVAARRLSAPLDELAEVSRRLGSGDFSARAAPRGVSEIDAVADALNHSAERIAALVATERRFSLDASHQLRTPLTALRMRLEELAGAEDLAMVREEAEAALVQADRLTATVTELLELRRRGRVGAQVEVDLASMVRRHATLWQESFARAGRRLEVVASRPVVVQASPGALSQALDVLLDNALRHGSGTVVVHAGAGLGATVRISDEGTGIAADYEERLFSRGADGAGVGIGLALARALVESDGGRLDLLQPRPPVFEIVLGTPPTSAST